MSFQKERIIQDQAERLKAFETKQQQSDLQMAEILKRQDQQIKDHISQIQALQRLIDDMKSHQVSIKSSSDTQLQAIERDMMAKLTQIGALEQQIAKS